MQPKAYKMIDFGVPGDILFMKISENNRFLRKITIFYHNSIASGLCGDLTPCHFVRKTELDSGRSG